MFARNTLSMLLGQGLRIVVQAGYFILVARALGAGEYGAFAGVVALVAIIAPFSSLGAGNLLIKNVSRNPAVFAECWGNALLLVGLSGTLLSGFVLICFRWALPASVHWLSVLTICLADILAVRIIEIAGQAFQARHELRFTALFSLLPSVLRMLAAAGVFAIWRHASVLIWAWAYLTGAALSALITIIVTTRRLGRPALALWRIRDEWREGLYFSAGLSAQTVYNDIDKTMLARLSSLEAAGIYAAAYRIIDVAFVPVRAVLFAAYPEFFCKGRDGLQGSFRYARRLLPVPLTYSLLSFAGLMLAAPIVPVLLGHEYAQAVDSLRWLAVLPVLKTVHYFMADSLTGAGYQGVRTAAQLLVAAANVVFNLWLIPAYAWQGAAWASIGSDALLILAFYGALRVLQLRDQEGALAASL